MLSKGCVYYTDNRADPLILLACQKQLRKSFDGEIISISLKPIDFGKNIVLNAERGRLTMFRQILLGLEMSMCDVVFLTENDVLYHPSHFDFIPTRKDIFYYNDNKWRVDFLNGQALFYRCAQTSGLCAYKELLIEHYKKRVEIVEKEGYNRNMGYEPGTHSKQFELWNSEFPNIDIRHNKCMTKNRWSQDQFRDKNSCLGWKLITPDDEIIYWGSGKKILEKILSEK